MVFFYLLQFLIPIGLVCLILWWFVLRPMFRKSLESDTADAESVALRQRLEEEFPDEQGAKGSSSQEEIDKAINELKNL